MAGISLRFACCGAQLGGEEWNWREQKKGTGFWKIRTLRRKEGKGPRKWMGSPVDAKISKRIRRVVQVGVEKKTRVQDDGHERRRLGFFVTFRRVKRRRGKQSKGKGRKETTRRQTNRRQTKKGRERETGRKKGPFSPQFGSNRDQERAPASGKEEVQKTKVFGSSFSWCRTASSARGRPGGCT